MNNAANSTRVLWPPLASVSSSASERIDERRDHRNGQAAKGLSAKPLRTGNADATLMRLFREGFSRPIRLAFSGLTRSSRETPSHYDQRAITSAEE
jgi:hypothetical protein